MSYCFKINSVSNSRKALAKSPVVKRAAAVAEMEQRRVARHRTTRYWLDDSNGAGPHPNEHIWLPSCAGAGGSSVGSTAPAGQQLDTECYLGERDCERAGEKRRCAACHIVAHTACLPLLAKMQLGCKWSFRDCGTGGVEGGGGNTAQQRDQLHKHHWVGGV